MLERTETNDYAKEDAAFRQGYQVHDDDLSLVRARQRTGGIPQAHGEMRSHHDDDTPTPCSLDCSPRDHGRHVGGAAAHRGSDCEGKKRAEEGRTAPNDGCELNSERIVQFP